MKITRISCMCGRYCRRRAGLTRLALAAGLV
jgi:hypothetical protein